MANKSNIRLAAANILLGRGVRFTISDAPFYWKILRMHRLHIRPLYVGTIVELTRIIDENGFDDISLQRDVNSKLDSVALLIAVAVLNNKYKIRCFSRTLARLLVWKVPAETLLRIFAEVVRVNKISDFMSITIYFGIQTQMMMNPRNTGREETGS